MPAVLPSVPDGLGYVDHVLASQPKTWWRLNSAVPADTMGNAPAVVNGMVESAVGLTPGMTEAVRFNRDALGDITAPNTVFASDPRPYFSVMVVFKIHAMAAKGVGTAWPSHLAALIAGETDGLGSAWELRLRTDGRLLVTFGGFYVLMSSVVLTLEGKYVVVIAKSGSAVRLYVNGVLAADELWTTEAMEARTFRFGGQYSEDFSHSMFQGTIGEVATWDYPIPLDATTTTSAVDLYRLSQRVLPAVETETALVLKRDLVIAPSLAVEEEIALPLVQAGGPEPVSLAGLTVSERERLLQDSLTDVEVVLVSSMGDDDTVGTEVARTALEVELIDRTMVNTGNLVFEELTAVQSQGWEVWRGVDRLWYGYWSPFRAYFGPGSPFTAVDHSLVDNDPIVLVQDAGGLTANTTYYVRDASGPTFNVSATPGGVALAATGTGFMTFGRVLVVAAGESLEVEDGQLSLTLK